MECREFVEKQVKLLQTKFEVDPEAFPSIPRSILVASLAKGNLSVLLLTSVNKKVIDECKTAHGEVAIQQVVGEIEEFIPEDIGNKRKRKDTSALKRLLSQIEAYEESLRRLKVQQEKYQVLLVFVCLIVQEVGISDQGI